MPIARHFCQNVMSEFGVEPDCAHGVALAITEACANVVEHSSDHDDAFEVALELDEEWCRIRIVDTGQGFDVDGLMTGFPEPGADRGRGVSLMRALVDRVEMQSRPDEGTCVVLEKHLSYVDSAPLAPSTD